MAAVALSLYRIEEHLLALADTAEMVAPDQEREYLQDFKAALTSAADKRDRVCQFLEHLEHQQSFADAEIKRLQLLKKHYASVQERLEDYVAFVIDSLGKDSKGKLRKLEGNTTVMYLRACPASVELLDETVIPHAYKRVTVTMPAELWGRVLNSLNNDMVSALLAKTLNTTQMSASKSEVKAALENGVPVPGARLITDKRSLRRM